MTSLLRVRTRADRSETRPPFTRNVGREDRLVRGCVALSLLLLGGFALLLSGQLGAISLLFVLLLGYFAGTAAAGWDPLYARTGIDTRSHRELAADGAAAWPVEGWQAASWDQDPGWADGQDGSTVLDVTDATLEATSRGGGVDDLSQHPQRHPGQGA